jgi:hypothetical protein
VPPTCLVVPRGLKPLLLHFFSFLWATTSPSASSSERVALASKGWPPIVGIVCAAHTSCPSKVAAGREYGGFRNSAGGRVPGLSRRPCGGSRTRVPVAVRAGKVLAYRAGLVAVRAQGFPCHIALGCGPGLSRRPCGSSRTRVPVSYCAWEWSWPIAQALWQFAHKGSRVILRLGVVLAYRAGLVAVRAQGSMAVCTWGAHGEHRVSMFPRLLARGDVT